MNDNNYLDDGRKPIQDLYQAFGILEKDGWLKEEIILSRGTYEGAPIAYPILSFKTAQKGPAIWVLSGIHGEEPAGPNAIAEGIAYLQALAKLYPVVVLPLCNPLGYARNWRYLNMPRWSEAGGEQSVGDSESVLPAFDNPNVTRVPQALSPESAAMIVHVLKLAKDYPPFMSLDFHEDDLIDEGYIYSQNDPHDPVALQVVNILSAMGIPIKKDGETRFKQAVVDGVVGQEKDGSIDELIAASDIILNGCKTKGPGAQTALVIETPADAMPLETRMNAQLEVIKNLGSLAKLVKR